jgi:ribose/xylose/arabinose/galactoside ABC-type transport system permease subunit
LSLADLDLGWIQAMTDLGRFLILLGAVAIVAGLALVLLGRTNIPLGRLPGDIIYRGKNSTFYFPLATSILVSVVLSVVMYLIGRLRR